jgi:hypothetical protein
VKSLHYNDIKLLAHANSAIQLITPYLDGLPSNHAYHQPNTRRPKKIQKNSISTPTVELGLAPSAQYHEPNVLALTDY